MTGSPGWLGNAGPGFGDSHSLSRSTAETRSPPGAGCSGKLSCVRFTPNVGPPFVTAAVPPLPDELPVPDTCRLLWKLGFSLGHVRRVNQPNTGVDPVALTVPATDSV